MARKDLSVFKERTVTADELADLLTGKYTEYSIIFSQLLAGKEADEILFRTAGMEIQSKSGDLLAALSIDSALCIRIIDQAYNIILRLKKYPDTINEFLLTKMRKMRKLYLHPINNAERDYALANARFVTAVTEKSPAAMEICALMQCHIDIFGEIKPIELYSSKMMSLKNFSPFKSLAQLAHRIFCHDTIGHSEFLPSDESDISAAESDIPVYSEQTDYSPSSQALTLSELNAFSDGSSISAEELDTLIANEYARYSVQLKESGQFEDRRMARIVINEKIGGLSKKLSIEYAPHRCVAGEANDICRLLKEYPDLVNYYLLMKMRRMKEIYLNPINDFDREYALASARFIKAVAEKNSAAIKICALAQCKIDISGAAKLRTLPSRIIEFKILENLLTESDFQNHTDVIEKAARRCLFGDNRPLTEEERASGHYHPAQKYFYLRGDALKTYLQKCIEHKSDPKEKRKPLDYDLNAS